MYSPKEKATAATVAIYCAFQRTNRYENTSTKVLSVQGQFIENHHIPNKLDSLFENNGGYEHERG